MQRAVAVLVVMAGAFLGACGGGEDDEADTRAVSTTLDAASPS